MKCCLGLFLVVNIPKFKLEAVWGRKHSKARTKNSRERPGPANQLERARWKPRNEFRPKTPCVGGITDKHVHECIFRFFEGANPIQIGNNTTVWVNDQFVLMGANHLERSE